jgi:predicted TIM-barrel fold metal-dependent hydrolase
MEYRVISADCHVDLCWLPPDLFTKNAPAALRDRMPYVAGTPRGPMWVTKKGANVLWRMDAEFEDQFKDLSLTMPPSGYWKRQCHATYQTDPIGVKLIDELGADCVMWGSDFPHPDGIWPDSLEYLERELGGLPAAVRRKIQCENAAKLYGFATT